jgi:hypothetical protein
MIEASKGRQRSEPSRKYGSVNGMLMQFGFSDFLFTPRLQPGVQAGLRFEPFQRFSVLRDLWAENEIHTQQYSREFKPLSTPKRIRKNHE